MRRKKQRMSDGHLVEETDFFSHCYLKDKENTEKKEGLKQTQSKSQSSVFFYSHTHLLPLSSSQSHWRKKEREGYRVYRVQRGVQTTEKEKEAKGKSTSFGAQQNFCLVVNKGNYKKAFSEANCEGCDRLSKLVSFFYGFF